MNIELDIIVILLIVVAVIGLLIFYRTGQHERFFKMTTFEDLADPHFESSVSSQTMLAAKKEEFLKDRHIVLHYIDKQDVRSGAYAASINSKKMPKSQTNETTTEVQGDANAGVGSAIQTGITATTSSRRVESYELSEDDIILGLFLDYRDHILMQGSVTLGLEEIEWPYGQFIDRLSTAFANVIEPNEYIDLFGQYTQEIPESMLRQVKKRIKDSQRLVLIKGLFEIKEVDNTYKYIYQHPVNKLIADESKHITISFSVPQNELHSTKIRTLYRDYKSMAIIVLGNIGKTVDDENGNLDLLPIAVY